MRHRGYTLFNVKTVEFCPVKDTFISIEQNNGKRGDSRALRKMGQSHHSRISCWRQHPFRRHTVQCQSYNPRTATFI